MSKTCPAQLVVLFVIFFGVAIQAEEAKLPTGQSTPEGVACDAVRTYFESDSKAWLGTLVKPMYGEEGNQKYAKFKDFMTNKMKQNKQDTEFEAFQIVVCYKAREFSANGPRSAAFALADFTGNKFVDIIVKSESGKFQGFRYHVLQDKNKKWYFNPRPDLAPLLSVGLNQEARSKDVLYERK